VKLLNAVAFANHLRDTDAFGEALLDAKRYEGDESEEEITRDRSNDPCTSTLIKAASKLDCVGMLIERRIWHEEVAGDLVKSINAFSDASPVTGAEIQGMLVDVCHKDGTVRKVTLPGANLSYGMTDAISKMMAFLWSAWLCFGPTLQHMRYFVEHMTCWTTDMGTENQCVTIPDCLEAFLAWVGGLPLEACWPMIRFDRRLFHRALRVGGWNHSLGNIMKRVAKSCVFWPEALDHIRCLIRFFRNETYSDWVLKVLGHKIDNLKKKMAITVQTAKWRFETVAEALRQLGETRQLCEHELDEAMFENAQDKVHIRDVFLACKDKRFWLFVVHVSVWVMGPLEHIRRWALICGCGECNRKRKEGAKHISCPRNGRRLREAWTWIQLRIAEFKTWARTVTVEQCEGSYELWNLIVAMCKLCASELRAHFKHLNVVPYYLIHANTIEGAKECVRQIEAQPIENHDPVTQDFVRAVGQDLKDRAAGGDLTTALEDRVEIFEDSMLDESRGEGFHRGTNLEKQRAAASTAVHMKQKLRIKGVVKTIRKLFRTHGKAGREVFRYEWSNWQRILQTEHKRRWRPKRMKFRAMLHRIYHQDEKANDNWGSILARIPERRPAEHACPTNRTQLQNEYYKEVFKPGVVYSVDHPVSTQQEDGRVVDEQQTDYFNVVCVTTGRTREHTMHTVATADDVQETQPFVIEAEMLDRWHVPPSPEGEAIPDDGLTRVVTESDAMWMVPEKIASFHALSHDLYRWTRVEPDTEHKGCLVLYDRELATPMLALTDPRMPTCVLSEELVRQGWNEHKHYVLHNVLMGPDRPNLYDSRMAIRQTFYFQCLLTLPATLPLCGGSLPSVHPVLFYRLLLRGEATLPHQGAAHYTNAWNMNKKQASMTCSQ